MEQKWKVVIRLALVCVVVLVFGFVIGHNIGFANGHGAGHAAGHDNGYSLGYLEGSADGYENGYDSGLNIGRTHGYNIHDPTYSEMKDFLLRDKTDENEYIPVIYECKHFVADVCRSADKENLRCAFVIIFFPEGGHACVAFNTIDKGLIFIEPMYDMEMDVEIGKLYWCRDIYPPPDYDDTIEDIIIIW